jgi:hypothetical protein
LIASNKVGICRRNMRPVKSLSISIYAVEGEYSVEFVESVEQRGMTIVAIAAEIRSMSKESVLIQ